MKTKLAKTIKDIYYEKKEIERIREVVRLILVDYRENPFDPYVYFLKIDSNDEKFGPRHHLELPGGGIEELESEIDAVKREALEEIGAEIGEIMPLGYIDIVYYPLKRVDRQNYYVCNVLNIKNNNLTDYEKTFVSDICKFPLSKCRKALSVIDQITVGKMIQTRDSLAIGKFIEKYQFSMILPNIYYTKPRKMLQLSSEVVIIKENGKIYAYDSGNNSDLAFYLTCLSQVWKLNVVISHFHEDHLTNLKHISFDKAYVSQNTNKYLKDLDNVIITNHFEDGKIKIIGVTSSHAKGSLVLSYDDNLLFAGDLIYPAYNYDIHECQYRYYNYYKLRKMKNELDAIEFKKIYSSHDMVPNKKIAVIKYSEQILKMKNKESEEIVV